MELSLAGHPLDVVGRDPRVEGAGAPSASRHASPRTVPLRGSSPRPHSSFNKTDGIPLTTVGSGRTWVGVRCETKTLDNVFVTISVCVQQQVSYLE